MSRPPETFDTSIPVLTDVIVPGKADLARTPPRAPEVLPVPGPALAEEQHARDAGRDVGRDAGRDADAIADRLRGRFTHFLTGDGRALIEERCRESLQEHSTWLVSQITREVALALETEMVGWVREAVAEELRRPPKPGAI